MTRGKKPYCNPKICPWDGFRAEIFGNIVIRGGEKSSVKVFLNIELQCVWVGGYHRQVGLESPAQLRRVCPPLVKSMLSSLCTPWPDLASKNCITYVEYLTGHWKSPNTNDSLTVKRQVSVETDSNPVQSLSHPINYINFLWHTKDFRRLVPSIQILKKCL